jgi:hypothetical protein
VSVRRRGKGYAYLRRSTSRQELGIHNQLEWAIGEAAKRSVDFDATLDDLDHMEKLGLKRFKGIFLDDGVSGADLDREAFTLFRRSAMDDSDVSHLFIFKADRFARPELAAQAMQMEIDLLLGGLTVCFHNRTSEPRERGLQYFAQDVQLLYEYSQSGQFLADLAERVLRAHITLANNGYWTGGPPPYGFVRVLVDGRDNVVQELTDGTYARRDGCHVRIRAKDPDKIRIWVQILDWYGNHGWGEKRISTHLNQLGIPSPCAGHHRLVRAVLTPVSGRWNHRQIARLLTNRAIVSELEYGKESLGAHRRYGADGPRLLTDADRNTNGKPRSTRDQGVPPIVGSTGYEPAVSRELFDACQEQKRNRGQNQRGIGRSSPATYPLSARVFDLSEGCGKLMYGSQSRGRRYYLCSAYSESSGRECARNQIDAEAALRFVLAVLRQRIVQLGGRRQIRDRLVHLAAQEGGRNVDHGRRELELAEDRQHRLDQELKVIQANLARQLDDDVFAAIEAEFKAKKREVDQHNQRLVTLRAQVDRHAGGADPDQQVDRAMTLLDQLDRITSDPAAREDIAGLLGKLSFMMGLRFAANTRGKRPLRIPVGGVITLGDPNTPIAR